MQDNSLLTAALEGLEAQKRRIQEQIESVQALLGGRRAAKARASGAGPGSPRRRELSPAARKRIAAAQKKRWAEYRRQHGA